MAKKKSAAYQAAADRLQREFGEKLQAARRTSRLQRNQSSLAARLEISRTTLSNLESGRHRVFLDQLYVAARELGVPINQLLPAMAEVFPPERVLEADSVSSIRPEIRAQVAKLAHELQETIDPRTGAVRRAGGRNSTGD